ncbi:MAG: TetR/AcrR family transcriptional regulator [Planctomycetota bacterium]|nr:MAG: TetR/AcrR family transcriptional regulator [Planctomycetota bacterium]
MLDQGHRTRDPEATRAAVLEAAERLFAEKGFANTSLRDISTASGVSHPLIHHHFGSKQELHQAVKRRLVENYAQRFPHAAKAVNRPLNLGPELRRLMAYIGDNPMLLRLCAWTRLEGDRQVWPGEPNMFETIQRRIEVSQRRKLFRDDLDPKYLTIMLMGLVMFWLDNREHFSVRFGAEMNDKDYLRQAVKILERGINITDAESSGADPTSIDEPVDESDE